MPILCKFDVTESGYRAGALPERSVSGRRQTAGRR